MAKPRLLITRPLPEVVLNAARAVCEVTVRPDNSYLSANEFSRLLAEYDALLPTLGDDLSALAFSPANPCNCKVIANFGVGYNHIDVAAAQARGITVTNTPGAVTDATADIAMTLLLMVARRAGEGERMLRAGKWQGWYPTQMLGTHIGGKTLGIIGMGRIGKAVAKRAHFGFGMKIIYFNRSAVKDCPVPDAQRIDSLKGLMALSDVVSVNVPGGARNRHMISGEVLSAAKPGSFLINTARGDVIDETALIAALQSGVLAGAGLDVYENEPQIPQALLDRENVTLLPHLGTNSLEVRTGMGLMAIDNIKAFFAGEVPPNKL